MYHDLNRTCIECDAPFTLSAGEQQFYDAKAFDLPKRCAACRKRRASEQPRNRAILLTRNLLDGRDAR